MVKRIIYFLIFSRLAIFAVTYFINFNLQPNFWLHILSFAGQWDSPHYLYIAEHGYQNFGDEANFIVFMPVYPIVIKVVSWFVSNYKLTALLISNISFVIGGYFFYKLLRVDYDEKFSAFVVVLISIFPTSYFFSAVYPESLYFLLFAVSAYYLRRHNFLKSSIGAGMASITRPFGIALWPMFLAESFLQKIKLKKIITMLAIGGIFYVFYLFINFSVYGNPLAFQTILKNHWGKSFDLPWNGIIQVWKITINGKVWDNYRVYVGLCEAVASTLAWIAVPFMFFGKIKIRISYAFYYLFGILMFTSTGFILSSPRYLLSLPPFFIIAAKTLKPKFLKIIWVVISSILLFYLAGLFSGGGWAL